MQVSFSKSRGSTGVTLQSTSGFTKQAYSRSRRSLWTNLQSTGKRSASTARTSGRTARSIPNDEIPHMSLFPTETKQTTRRFLVDLHRRYQLDGVEFLVEMLAISARFRPKTATGFKHSHMEIGVQLKCLLRRRTPNIFARKYFWHVELETAENWPEAFAASQCMSNLTRCSQRDALASGETAVTYVECVQPSSAGIWTPFADVESAIRVCGRTHTVGCQSVPDFVEPVGEIPVHRYNRPYQGIAHL